MPVGKSTHVERPQGTGNTTAQIESGQDALLKQLNNFRAYFVKKVLFYTK